MRASNVARPHFWSIDLDAGVLRRRAVELTFLGAADESLPFFVIEAQLRTTGVLAVADGDAFRHLGDLDTGLRVVLRPGRFLEELVGNQDV